MPRRDSPRVPMLAFKHPPGVSGLVILAGSAGAWMVMWGPYIQGIACALPPWE